MRDPNTRVRLLRLLGISAMSLLPWFGGCVGTPQEKSWIMVGMTTRDEVVTRYGQPDIVQMSSDGSMVTYWPRSVQPVQPRMEIPTVQAGPLGTTTTQMTPIEPGLDRTARQERPLQEIQIRYDAQGIVREVMP